jgi:hypothetical protein
MARMLGKSHVWGQRFCPWRESDFSRGKWPRGVQVVFKRRHRRIEQRRWRRVFLEQR